MSAVLDVELSDSFVLRAARDTMASIPPARLGGGGQKFDRVTQRFFSPAVADRIAGVIDKLDARPVSDRTACLAFLPSAWRRRRQTVAHRITSGNDRSALSLVFRSDGPASDAQVRRCHVMACKS
jgi:hypothetical protein